jgi:3-hydroxyacyl-CoA dehydrogenase/enoyl-CoA hydratase/3-hydroxybutyryl-CoA epimerase
MNQNASQAATPSSTPDTVSGVHGTDVFSLQHWRMEIDPRNVCLVTFDRQGSSTNVLSSAVLMELNLLLARIEEIAPSAVIFRSAKRGFIAGADISEFGGLENAEQAYQLIRQGQLVISRIAELPCATVAAINGFALGGGLELALACRYRVVVDDPGAVLGLPEVKLGIHPGFGGTVRSLRLLGALPAMSMMLTGRNVRSREARRIGLVDQVVPSRHLDRAAYALATTRPPPSRRPLSQTVLDTPFTRPFVLAMLRRQLAREARPEHYPAPWAMVDLWQRHGDSSLGTFLDAEARSIAHLMCTQTSRNLVRVFGLQERLKSLAGRGAPRVGHVHVIGAGLMGGDIAAWCAMQGCRVTLQDREAALLTPAFGRARKLFQRRLRDPRRVTAACDRLIPDPDGDGVAKADVIIEAIFENLEAKQALFRDLEARARPEALLATNTSSIRLERIATALTGPARLVGLHFFNPVPRLPLVEVIGQDGTDPAALARGVAFVKQIGKLPLPCASAPGFLVNRVLMPYLMEAFMAVEDGYDLAQVDAAAVRFGMPAGPVELADTVGLDVCLLVSRVFAEEFGLPVPGRLTELVDAGHLGRKSGRGFYRWQAGKAVRPPAKGSVASSPLARRLILPMVNEAVRCLREGVVDDPDLIDAGIIFGTGFAPFTGGPLQYARSRGVDTITGELAQLAKRHGERFSPDAGWTLLG